MSRALMQALRALAIGARRGGAKSLIAEARGAADAMDALSNYALVTGSLGGLGGMLMSAGDVESRGGDQDDINEAAYHGGRTGAMLGPATFGPALGLTAAAGPVGGTPIVLYALGTGSEGSRRFDERLRKREQDEAVRRALEMRLRGLHE